MQSLIKRLLFLLNKVGGINFMLELVKKYRKEKKELGILLELVWRKWKFNEQAINAVRKFLKRNNKVVVVPFSGSRNSRALVRVIFETLQRERIVEREIKIVHVKQQELMLSDTIKNLFEALKGHFQKYNVSFHILDEMTDDFFLKVIGQGIPAPKPAFWWCGQNNKISPFIEFIKKYDEVEILSCVNSGKRNELHPAKNSYMFKPFSSYSDQDMWEVFLHSTPWGDDIGDVFTLYENYYETNSPLDYEEEPAEVRGGCGTLGFDSPLACWHCTYSREEKVLQKYYLRNPWIRPLVNFKKILKETMLEQKIDELNMQRSYQNKKGREIDDRKNYNRLESETLTYIYREKLFYELLETEKKVNYLRQQQKLPSISIISKITKKKIVELINNPIFHMERVEEKTEGVQLELF